MNKDIKSLIEERVFFHFYQICQIPHGSGNEKALSDYLLHWAKDLGLYAKQDNSFNVFIRKPASVGREGAPTVLLQAHMDMVCEKAEGVRHDFVNDPIDWVIDGDTLSTGGKTTLGADNGIGVALIMALLEDNELGHPPLEALFTTMEEEDLSGAEHFDTSEMSANILINLDHVKDDEILCGSCGGMQVDFRLPVNTESVPDHWRTFTLNVTGLKGGHSGEDIHRGRGNACVLLTRCLMAIDKEARFLLHSIKGGSFRLAIPRAASAVILADEKDAKRLTESVTAFEQLIRHEFPDSGDNIRIQLMPCEESCSDGTDPSPVLSALSLIPDGIHQMSEVFEGIVETSDNLGEVYLDDKELHLVLEIRSAKDSLRAYLFERMERLAILLGGTCESSNAYPSWDFRPDSSFRELCGKVYRDLYGTPPKFLVVHAGLEVGCFFHTKNTIDAVSLGPNMKNFHSPSESLEISSVRKEFTYLCAVLSSIR